MLVRERPQQSVWAPMEYDAMPRWSFMDWMRFYFYRHAWPASQQISSALHLQTFPCPIEPALEAVGVTSSLWLHGYLGEYLKRSMCRHSIEVVLVAVVALCTLENDVIHAAYLAVVLLLFRRRDALRLEGNRLFRLLSICNFAVMLMTLLYQAPVINKWGRPYGPELVRMPRLLNATDDRDNAVFQSSCLMHDLDLSVIECSSLNQCHT